MTAQHAKRDSGDGSATSREAVFWMGGDPRWQPPADLLPLTTALQTDVCIVGGGFTGLWTALAIKRLAAGTDVVLLEREFCGAGASGRNGGWVNGWEDALPKLIGRFGDDGARWLLDESLRGIELMSQTTRDGGVDCDLTLNGGLTLATSPAQLEGLREPALAAERLGRDDLLRELTAEEAQAMSGAPNAIGGFYIEHAGSVQPALLAQGLRRLAIAAGVHVFEATPMTRLRRTVPAVVETPAGKVVAEKVVLATSARMAAVSELRRTLFVIPAHIVATETAGERLNALGWEHGRPFADGRTAVHYGQRTGDDRMIFGRGGGRLGFWNRVIAEHYHDEAQTRSITADLGELFPSMRDARIEWAWGGPVERTQHGLPWVGTLGPHGNVHYGVGYSGNGVAPSTVVSRHLASVALGLDDEYAASPLVSDPPSYLPVEPLRSIGARVVRSAIERCEREQDAGRNPDPFSRFASRGLDVTLPKGPSLPSRWRRY